MKKTFLTLIIAFCCWQLTFASISNKSAAKQSVNHLLDSAENFSRSNKELAESLVEQASSYASKINFDFGIARSKFLQGYIAKVNGKSDTGIIYYLEACQLLNELDDDNSILYNAIANENIALIYHRHHQYDKAIEHLDRSLILSKRVGSKFNKN